MKPLLLAAAVLILAPVVAGSGAAQAQVAAGTMPNTFDDPAARSRAAATPAPQTAPAEPALDPTPANAASEETLRTLIGQLQAGEPDYAGMTDPIATAVREQSVAMKPVIEGFGEVVSVAFVGSRDGIDVYDVIFANASTRWMIGVNPEGKISALLFRPAE